MMVLRYARSLAFNAQMYVMMAIMGLVFLPLALASPKGARFACKTYCRWVLWTARWMVGIDAQVQGAVPTGAGIVASKHQSFLDIIILFNALPQARFIMKKELIYAPVLGQYALRLGCVPVDRGKRGRAVAQMVADVLKNSENPGQLVIYPQGTRVLPGVKKPYKIGAAALYQALGQSCYPVATNAGLFWPRRGILRTPGRAVIQFLTDLPAGLENDVFMARLESEVETHSDTLMEAAGFHAKNQ